jgi:formate hydrogenlyase subunit 4
MNNQLQIAILALILAPLAAIIIKGLDRKLTARMQGRIGPPLLQPLYDLIKLWAKDNSVTPTTQLVWAYGYLGFMAAGLLIFLLGGDILMMLFVLALGGVCFVLGALSIKSPYSHIGGNRELIQMMAYEPILFLAAFAIFFQNKSFKLNDIMEKLSASAPLLYSLPLVFVALVFVLIIKLRKSPFDIALSHHAHQEIVRGPITEYSGKYLAMVELAEYYELILIMGLLAIFWLNPLWAGIGLAFSAYFIVMIIDNISARLTWQVMLAFSWIFGLGLIGLNILVIYLIK